LSFLFDSEGDSVNARPPDKGRLTRSVIASVILIFNDMMALPI